MESPQILYVGDVVAVSDEAREQEMEGLLKQLRCGGGVNIVLHNPNRISWNRNGILFQLIRLGDLQEPDDAEPTEYTKLVM